MTPLVEELIPAPDPERCCERFAGLPHRLFLDSASRDERLGQHSFLCADPVLVIRSKGASAERIDSDGARHAVRGDALNAIREILAPHLTEPVDGLPPFQGGAAGYIAYDWGLTLERLPAPRYDDLALDDVVLGVYDWVIAWDHGRPSRLADLDGNSGGRRSGQGGTRAGTCRLGSRSTGI
jgi:para-aminobenzoate synthetase component 1